MEYRLTVRADLEDVLRLCAAEGWSTYCNDPEATWRALTAPGVWTVVAVTDGIVAGFAQMQSDGVIQAHLSLIAVADAHRGKGIGQRLVEEALRHSGGQRVDLLSATAAEFYRSFSHKEMPGFRIYP